MVGVSDSEATLGRAGLLSHPAIADSERAHRDWCGAALASARRLTDHLGLRV